MFCSRKIGMILLHECFIFSSNTLSVTKNHEMASCPPENLLQQLDLVVRILFGILLLQERPGVSHGPGIHLRDRRCTNLEQNPTNRMQESISTLCFLAPRGCSPTLALTLPCSFSCSRIMSTSSMLHSWLSSDTLRDISSMATSMGFISVLCCSTTWMRFFRYGKLELAVKSWERKPSRQGELSMATEPCWRVIYC